MKRFSANLGFLWQELSLPNAIRAAHKAGFGAVECHWPYDTQPTEITMALQETGLKMLGLNTPRGNLDAGENGLCALVGREDDARAAIDQAIEYAVAINTPNIHVMAGFAHGDAAETTFLKNLRYATEKASVHDITILIEPLNHHDAPGYFLQTAEQAAAIIEKVGSTNLKLMFDCYHLQIMGGDLTRQLTKFMPITGHIQIASVPTRTEPDDGEIDYAYIMKTIHDLGFTTPVGAEYKSKTTTEAGLNWIDKMG